jgi:DNA-binding transcriptional MocR family regulator
MTHYTITGKGSAAIAESIEQAITSGSLSPGDLLPPIRELAGELGVSPGTVAAAYGLTRRRGLTVAERRRGTRVREWRLEHAPPARLAPGRRLADDGYPRAVDLASGNPDPRLLPDLRPLLARLADSRAATTYRQASYGSPLLDPRLEEVSAERLAADGIPVPALTCTAGALDAIHRVLTTSLQPGDRVAVEDPGWPSLLRGLDRWGLVPLPLPLDDEGPDPERLWDALAGGARAVVITRQAQNPTGAALSPTRAEAVAGVLARYPGVLLVEDDHGDGIAGITGRPDIASPGSVVAARRAEGRFAFVRSASKAYGPDLRLAVLTGDPATVGRVEASVVTTSGWVSHLLQQLVAALWSDDVVSRTVAEAESDYRRRRSALLAALEGAGVAAHGVSGLNVWVPLPDGAPSDEASCIAALLAEGWEASGGAAFRLASPPALRITAASLAVEKAGDVARAVAAAIAGTGRAAY